MTPDPTDLQVYTLPTGPWTSFALPAQCAEADYGGESMNGCNVDAVGRDWLELDSFAYHSPDASSYQNLDTGQVHRSRRDQQSRWTQTARRTRR